MLHHRKEKMRQTLIKLLALYMSLTENKSKRSVWVRPIFTVEQRFLQGDSNNLIPMLKTTDEPLHFNYLRVDSTTFEELFLLVGPYLETSKYSRANCISYKATNLLEVFG